MSYETDREDSAVYRNCLTPEEQAELDYAEAIADAVLNDALQKAYEVTQERQRAMTERLADLLVFPRSPLLGGGR